VIREVQATPAYRVAISGPRRRAPHVVRITDNGGTVVQEATVDSRRAARDLANSYWIALRMGELPR
jgi:membrane peptidoglycan carboxypeptidase